MKLKCTLSIVVDVKHQETGGKWPLAVLVLYCLFCGKTIILYIQSLLNGKSINILDYFYLHFFTVHKIHCDCKQNKYYAYHIYMKCTSTFLQKIGYDLVICTEKKEFGVVIFCHEVTL
ncbi:LOW QUALITY PROTEIN: Protein of unknown function [Gryllus bimaculatus]|nr:LOW QUALITY PROTEIN: Protein of unknown function [Gryllus bimaculatus]